VKDVGGIGDSFIEKVVSKTKEIGDDLMKKLDQDIRAALDIESRRDDGSAETKSSIVGNLFELWQKNINATFERFKQTIQQTILELSQDEELRENIGKTISQPILEVTRDFVTKLEIVIERARAGLVKDVGEIREDFMKDASQLANEVVEKVDDIAVNTTADITHAATGFTEDLNRVVGRLDGATIVPTNCDGWFGIPRGARVNLGS
jgi:hypothetical protein